MATKLKGKQALITKSFLRTDPAVYYAIINAMHDLRWTNKHLLEACQYLGVNINAPRLSVYLKHGGNKDFSLTDEAILMICGILGINLKIITTMRNYEEKSIHTYFNNFFPKSKYKMYENLPYKLVEFYKSKGVILENGLTS